MPSPSTSRTRRSRAPSPESQPSAGADLFTKVAKGVLAYSFDRYLTRQLSSSQPQPSHSHKTSEDMPSKRSSSRSDQSRAFGFSFSNSRRDDPTHELISHLLRGAAALAVRHWVKNRKKAKSEDKSNDKSKSKSKPNPQPTPYPYPNLNSNPPPPRDTLYPVPAPSQSQPPPPHHRRRHHRPHRHRPNTHYPCAAPRPTVPKQPPELVTALDSLSKELGRTTTRIRQLAGQRRPHRHRDGRCDVYEGLRECAGRLEGEVDRVRVVGNNIRNLGDVPMGDVDGGGGRRDMGDGVGGERRREGRDGSWVRNMPVTEQRERAGSYVRTRPTEGGAGSYVRSREVPEGGRRGKGRKVRVRGEEDRGRKRTRSR